MIGFVLCVGAAAYRLSVDSDYGTFCVFSFKPVYKTL